MGVKVIMVRHGYSISNDLRFFTGHMDVALTDKGKEQAELCSRLFRHQIPAELSDNAGSIYDLGIERIDRIYSSDLCRAYETALPIAKVLGLTVEKTQKLREINGGKWDGMYFTDIDDTYSKEYAVWKNDIGHAEPVGGESVKAMWTRITCAVRELAERQDGGAIVLVTHATPIRIMCTLARGAGVEDMADTPWVSNASVSVFDFDGEFRPVMLNITSHLGVLKTDLPRGV